MPDDDEIYSSMYQRDDWGLLYACVGMSFWVRLNLGLESRPSNSCV